MSCWNVFGKNKTTRVIFIATRCCSWYSAAGCLITAAHCTQTCKQDTSKSIERHHHLQAAVVVRVRAGQTQRLASPRMLMFCEFCPIKRQIHAKQKHLLTNPIQHNAVPALLGQCKLPVELKLDSVVSPHLVNEQRIITNHFFQSLSYIMFYNLSR